MLKCWTARLASTGVCRDRSRRNRVAVLSVECYINLVAFSLVTLQLNELTSTLEFIVTFRVGAC
jgi:hypothetical protein